MLPWNELAALPEHQMAHKYLASWPLVAPGTSHAVRQCCGGPLAPELAECLGACVASRDTLRPAWMMEPTIMQVAVRIVYDIPRRNHVHATSPTTVQGQHRLMPSALMGAWLVALALPDILLPSSECAMRYCIGTMQWTHSIHLGHHLLCLRAGDTSGRANAGRCPRDHPALHGIKALHATHTFSMQIPRRFTSATDSKVPALRQ